MPSSPCICAGFLVRPAARSRSAAASWSFLDSSAPFPFVSSTIFLSGFSAIGSAIHLESDSWAVLRTSSCCSISGTYAVLLFQCGLSADFLSSFCYFGWIFGLGPEFRWVSVFVSWSTWSSPPFGSLVLWQRSARLQESNCCWGTSFWPILEFICRGFVDGRPTYCRPSDFAGCWWALALRNFRNSRSWSPTRASY